MVERFVYTEVVVGSSPALLDDYVYVKVFFP